VTKVKNKPIKKSNNGKGARLKAPFPGNEMDN